MQQIFAHRGVSALAIENTASAIKLCVKHNILAVEIDLQLLGDNTPVLFHDIDLKRLANKDDALINLSAQSIKNIQLNMDNKKSESVLFMDEFIQLVLKHNLKVNVELKRFEQSINHYIEYIIKPLLSLVPNEQLLISGFDFELLKAVRGFSKTVDIAILSRKLEMGLFEKVNEISAIGCHLKNEFLDIKNIKKIKEQVKYLGVFTVNDQTRYQELIQAGVDYVFSDVPHLLNR
ncbi:MAG: hypothetical protein HRU38_14715 [Saccharospirillaceae bacterium]|nr:hypothetical protein [Pseudomonadales bacterium]NRB79894.1 hypothetical protein [Saccharospirillaceae bacterium]